MESSAENSAQDVVATALRRWREGETPDVGEVLAKYPQVREHKTLVLDLAYEEYCMRNEGGSHVQPSEFCRQFPEYSHSMRRLLEVHDYADWDALGEDPLEQVSDLATGEMVLQYRIVERLGRGSFARVYLAEDTDLGNRLVAIKISWRGCSEAQMMGRMANKNVVPVFSIQHDPETDLTIVCMPFLGASTLWDVLDVAFAKDTPPADASVILRAARCHASSRDLLKDSEHALIDPTETYVTGIAQLGMQLASALAYTHRQGILHCDLKPSNVLLTPNGRPMLLDFNLSSDLSKEDARRGGTLPYMSTEQLRGLFLLGENKSVELDGRCDVFGLGCVLYELLTGKLPFADIPSGLSAVATAETLISYHEAGAVSIRELNAAVPVRLASVVESCLHTRREDRPDAESLCRDFEKCLPSRRFNVRKWLGTRKAFFVIFCITLLTVGWATFELAGDFLIPTSWSSIHRKAQAGDIGFVRRQVEKRLQRDPNDLRAQFLRGQTYAVEEKFVLAIEDFDEVAKESKHPQVAIWCAYAQMRNRNTLLAAICYSRAVDDGVDDFRVRNNWGYCLMLSGDSTGACKQLEIAVRMNSEAVVPRYNRARGLARICSESVVYEPSLLKTAIDDIEKVLDQDGHPAQYKTAATIYALASEQDPTIRNVAKQRLVKALELGQSWHSVESDPLLNKLVSKEEYDALDVNASDSSPMQLWIEPKLFDGALE